MSKQKAGAHLICCVSKYKGLELLVELALLVQRLWQVGDGGPVKDGPETRGWAKHATASVRRDLINQVVVHVLDRVLGYRAQAAERRALRALKNLVEEIPLPVDRIDPWRDTRCRAYCLKNAAVSSQSTASPAVL